MLFDSDTTDVFLELFASSPVRELAAGQILVHAGEPVEQVFNVISGTMMISRIGLDGRRQVLSFVFKDHFVGLSSSDSYFFTVEALTDARVSCLSRQVLENHLADNPAAERAFRNVVYRVLESSLDLVYSLGQRTAVERLAVFLLYLRHRQRLALSLPDDSTQLDNIELPMSRQDIADFLGLKKETVSRSFTQLDNRALIDRPDNLHVLITSLAGLRELAGIQDFASPSRATTSR